MNKGGRERGKNARTDVWLDRNKEGGEERKREGG